jgi:hypothetical protein
MGTDTWWKYSDPDQSLTMGYLIDHAGGELLAKLTTSWLATIKHLVTSYTAELLLACGLLVALSRRSRQDPPAANTPRPLRAMALFVGFALVVNLAILPLYAYQNYAWRHYLGFALPVLWLGAGHAAHLVLERARPAVARAREHVGKHASAWIAIGIVAILGWNLGGKLSKAPDANTLFTELSRFAAFHWLTAVILVALLLAHRWVLRPPWYPRAVVLVVALVAGRLQPMTEVKRFNLAFFPANDGVWSALKARKGIVSSFALQSEVAWSSGRKNIPAPEYVMHLYSYLYDHGIEVEDIYLESVGTGLAIAGPFAGAAPGFDGYARLQSYQGRLPGYEIAYHHATTTGYAKYGIKPVAKASTLYRLVDRAAVQAMRDSPDRIDLADPANMVHTAFGFAAFYSIEGQPVVAVTDINRIRYQGLPDAPYEDAAVTFFLDERRPTSVGFEFYAPHATTFEFYWNADLYHYDTASERRARHIGTVTTTGKGWQRAHLVVPPGVTRAGLNKLGWRAGMEHVLICPIEISDEACLIRRPHDERTDNRSLPTPLRLSGATSVVSTRIEMLARALEFHYPAR